MTDTTAKGKTIPIDDPIRKLIHELTDPNLEVKVDLCGFGPLEDGGPSSYGIICTGPKANIIAEMLVGYLQTIAARQEQKIVSGTPLDDEGRPRIQ